MQVEKVKKIFRLLKRNYDHKTSGILIREKKKRCVFDDVKKKKKAD